MRMKRIFVPKNICFVMVLLYIVMFAEVKMTTARMSDNSQAMMSTWTQSSSGQVDSVTIYMMCHRPANGIGPRSKKVGETPWPGIRRGCSDFFGTAPLALF
jgi:hypothetical protein